MANEPVLKPGDVVCLRSTNGKPQMTVEAVANSEGVTEVKCVWQTLDAVHRDTFPEAALRKVDPKEGQPPMASRG
jgi:uncharacterized protein YodC (DUF2158 family)